MAWLLLWLLLLGGGGGEAPRHYHPVALVTFATSRYTHVAVRGRVAVVRREGDGDAHIRLVDEAGHFVIGEIVPYHRLPLPKRGQVIVLRGIRRYDDAPGHGWWEVHPVESWEVAPPVPNEKWP